MPTEPNSARTPQTLHMIVQILYFCIFSSAYKWISNMNCVHLFKCSKSGRCPYSAPTPLKAVIKAGKTAKPVISFPSSALILDQKWQMLLVLVFSFSLFTSSTNLLAHSESIKRSLREDAENTKNTQRTLHWRSSPTSLYLDLDVLFSSSELCSIVV